MATPTVEIEHQNVHTASVELTRALLRRGLAPKQEVEAQDRLIRFSFLESADPEQDAFTAARGIETELAFHGWDERSLMLHLVEDHAVIVLFNVWDDCTD